MIRKSMTGIAAIALLLPAAAFADVKKEHGTFEMWTYEVGDSKVYAVANPADGSSVAAEIEGREMSVSTGAAADEIIEKVEQDIQKSLPKETVVELDGDHEVRLVGDTEDVFLLKADGVGSDDVDQILKEHGIDWVETDGDDEKVVIKKKIHKESTDGVNVEVEVMVDDHDIVSTETEGEIKRIVIRKHRNLSDHDVVIDLDTESDVEGEVRKRVKVLKMPQPPAPPVPGSVNDRNASTYEYEFSDDSDGEETSKRFMRIKGADADEAADFINDLKGVSRSDKRKMKEALSL